MFYWTKERENPKSEKKRRIKEKKRRKGKGKGKGKEKNRESRQKISTKGQERIAGSLGEPEGQDLYPNQMLSPFYSISFADFPSDACLLVLEPLSLANSLKAHLAMVRFPLTRSEPLIVCNPVLVC